MIANRSNTVVNMWVSNLVRRSAGKSEGLDNAWSTSNVGDELGNPARHGRAGKMRGLLVLERG